MKFLRMPVTALAALTFTFAVQAQTPTADEIVSKHIEAIGGKDKISSLKSIVVDAEMDIMGTGAPSTTTILFGKGQLSEINYNGQKIVNCVTADKGGWSINPLMGQVSAEPMPEDQVKASQPQLTAGGSLYNYAANGYKVELAGQEEINGVKAWKLQVTTKEGASFTHFIDPTTYYILRTIAKANVGGNPIEQGINFTDYKKTEVGYVMPYAYSIEMPNGMSLNVTVKNVTVNKAIDPKIFDKP